MKTLDPVNVWLMDVDKTIKNNGLREVKSSFIYTPSSSTLHPEGFFSEEIFGQIGTSERLSTLAYISLNTTLISPHLFKNILDVKPLYNDLMQGKIYAVYNPDVDDLIPSTKDNPEAGTGYSFFIKNFKHIKFERNNSLTRNNKITTIEEGIKTNTILIQRMIISPAGIRDIKEKNGRLEIEDVNKLYTSLFAMAQEVISAFNNPILEQFYDGIKYNMQLKVYEIYKYYENMFSGKSGFGQNKWAHRTIANGTRNVITSSKLIGNSVNDPAFHKCNETIAPLYQVCKAYQPIVVYELKSLFFSQLYTLGSTKVPGINTKTYKVEYIDVSTEQITEALSTKASEDLINLFQNVHMRDKPAIIKDINNKYYYISLMYDLGDIIYELRNVDDFKQLYESTNDNKFDISKLRPMTYVEMLYLAAYNAVHNKYSISTRYPAIETGSTYPSKTNISTTSPSRVVKFKSQYNPTERTYPMYPVIGQAYLDSLIIHPSQTPGLGA